MKYAVLLFTALVWLVGCNQSKPSGETDDASNTTSELSSEATVELKTSYEVLKTLLDTKQPVYGDYLLINGKPALEGMVQEHILQQESDNYLIVRSRDGGTMVSRYYLLSFSKNTGQLISFVEVGQETEGVDPMLIKWLSPTSFTAIEYNHELLEDEESGAYMKGALLDSIVRNYQVSSQGEFFTEN